MCDICGIPERPVYVSETYRLYLDFYPRCDLVREQTCSICEQCARSAVEAQKRNERKFVIVVFAVVLPIYLVDVVVAVLFHRDFFDHHVRFWSFVLWMFAFLGSLFYGFAILGSLGAILVSRLRRPKSDEEKAAERQKRTHALALHTLDGFAVRTFQRVYPQYFTGAPQAHRAFVEFARRPVTFRFSIIGGEINPERKPPRGL